MDCKVDSALSNCFIYFFFKYTLFIHGKERPLVNISLGAYGDYFKPYSRVHLVQGGKCYFCLRYCKPTAPASNSYRLVLLHLIISSLLLYPAKGLAVCFYCFVSLIFTVRVRYKTSFKLGGRDK